MITPTQLNSLKGVAMDPSKSTKEAYYTINSAETGETLTVISSGKNGVEYNKTHGYFNKYQGPVVYRCLYGHGIILIQRNDAEGNAKEVRIAGIRPGAEVEVPAGCGHTVINTGKSFLMVADNSPTGDKYKDFETIKDEQGLAYYVIEKKGEIYFEKNKNYSYHPQLAIY